MVQDGDILLYPMEAVTSSRQLVHCPLPQLCLMLRVRACCLGLLAALLLAGLGGFDAACAL